MNKNLVRNLPGVDEVLGTEGLKDVPARYNRETVVEAVRAVLDEIRRGILAGAAGIEETDLTPEAVAAAVSARLAALDAPSLVRAINATGILLHTGLGRALLPDAARELIAEAAAGYCTLAVDRDTGRRGRRDEHVRRLLCQLTGAEDATVANNNAAATVLILNALARGKEVIVSRGQLVEIGGSFRLPEVMAVSGAALREVGTTNKTHLADYENAVSDNTGAILKVHQSNYRIVGFTEEPGIEELVKLGARHNLPVVDDLGSGALVDLAQFGLEAEPLVRESIAAGADVVCFSGDKLIGGPQSGIIVGKKAVVERIRKDPLARAFRVGKLTLAGLEGTLRLFLNQKELVKCHPFYRMLASSMEELRTRAGNTSRALGKELKGKTDIEIIEDQAQVGSGSVPAQTIPSVALALRPSRMSADELARRLRQAEPPVFGRVQKDAVRLDFRTIQPSEDETVIRVLRNIPW